MNYEEYRMMEEKWIEVLQENTKLKAEIEQYVKLINEQSELNVSQFKQLDTQYQEIEKLKAELKQWESTNLNLCTELTRVECENHQLKKDKSNKNCVDCKTYIEHDEDSNCIKCKNHSNFMEGGAE